MHAATIRGCSYSISFAELQGVGTIQGRLLFRMQLKYDRLDGAFNYIHLIGCYFKKESTREGNEGKKNSGIAAI